MPSPCPAEATLSPWGAQGHSCLAQGFHGLTQGARQLPHVQLTLRMSRLRSFCTSMRRVCATLNRCDICGQRRLSWGMYGTKTWLMRTSHHNPCNHLGAHSPSTHCQPRHLLLGEVLDREDMLADEGVQQRGGLEVGCALGGCLAWKRAQLVEVAVLDHSWICSTKSSQPVSPQEWCRVTQPTRRGPLDPCSTHLLPPPSWWPFHGCPQLGWERGAVALEGAGSYGTLGLALPGYRRCGTALPAFGGTRQKHRGAQHQGHSHPETGWAKPQRGVVPLSPRAPQNPIGRNPNHTGRRGVPEVPRRLGQEGGRQAQPCLVPWCPAPSHGAERGPCRGSAGSPRPAWHLGEGMHSSAAVSAISTAASHCLSESPPDITSASGARAVHSSQPPER